jgi:hypothetical protein
VSPVAKKAVAAVLLMAGAAGAYVIRSARRSRRGTTREDAGTTSPGVSNGAIRVTKTSPFPSTR